MEKVCVITGGGSGMGLETAKVMGKDYYIIIAGRTISKLQGALDELKEMGIKAEAYPCDVSNYASVEQLAIRAKKIGTIDCVIHAAGLSPHMANAETLMAVNALGTIHMNEVFCNYMEEGSCLIDVASMSGYMVPNFLLPVRRYKSSRDTHEVFMNKMMSWINLFPKKLRSSIAYAVSKNFVIWYAKTDANKFGKKGIRVLSISPGSFETPMGEAEEDGLGEYIEKSAFGRIGQVEEIAHLIAFCADKRVSYLTGVDILCDGGCIASRMTR